MALLLVDTNFFIDCLRCGIPLDEIERFGEVLIPENVLSELEHLSLKGKEEGLRRVTREWMRRYKIFNLSGSVDSSFLRLAESQKIIVATNDSRLRKSLNDRGSHTILIRSRSHLVLDSP